MKEPHPARPFVSSILPWGRGWCCLLAVHFGLLAAQGQWVREGNNTIKLPTQVIADSTYSTENALGSLTFKAPMLVASIPGERDRLFVIERAGKIQVVTGLQSNPTIRPTPLFDLGEFIASKKLGNLPTNSELGLLGFAFHPKYVETMKKDGRGDIYVFHSLEVQEGRQQNVFECVARFTVVKSDGEEKVDPGSYFPMIAQLDHSSNHNGGDVHFGSDGYLYFSMGDEGAQNDSHNNATWIDKAFFGAISRLDVDQKPGSLEPHPLLQDSTAYPSAVVPGTYRVPADNPFIGATTHNGRATDPNSVRTEIWATGFRNPWRFSFDPPTGRMFIGDVGQDGYEEVDLGQRGGNYGWSFREGSHPGPRKPAPAGVEFIPPIHEYPHGTGEDQGLSITGGVVDHGTRLPELRGAYLFADHMSGHIWALREQGGAWTSKRLATDAGLASFGLDPRDGGALLVDLIEGKVKRLTNNRGEGSQPPALLSQTGIFSDLTQLTPSSGVVAYEPIIPQWNDYAVATHWFSIPRTKNAMSFRKDRNWALPAGMVNVQHLEIETRRGDPASRRRLETRLLVETGFGGSYGIAYRWRADQSDADLVPEEGALEDLKITVDGAARTQSWRFPGRSECRLCHTPIAGNALGFNHWQLNRPGVGPLDGLNQLAALREAGYLNGVPNDVKTLPALAAADDATQPLEWRVRSYLAANCVQCHQPGGSGLGNWDARPGTDLAAANIVNGALLNNGGDPANRFAVPGDVAHSVVLKRLQADGFPRMPQLGTSQTDPTAVRLFTEWLKPQAAPNGP